MISSRPYCCVLILYRQGVIVINRVYLKISRRLVVGDLKVVSWYCGFGRVDLPPEQCGFHKEGWPWLALAGLRQPSACRATAVPLPFACQAPCYFCLALVACVRNTTYNYSVRSSVSFPWASLPSLR